MFLLNPRELPSAWLHIAASVAEEYLTGNQEEVTVVPGERWEDAGTQMTRMQTSLC